MATKRTYEEACIIWAAKKYGIPRHQIEEVTLSESTGWGGYCDTCQFSFPILRTRVKIKNSDKIKTFEEKDVEMVTILRELFDV